MADFAWRGLHKLASLYGVQTSYYDIFHKRRLVSPDTVLAILKALDAPVNSSRDITSAIREAVLHQWWQPIEPVNVLWAEENQFITLRLPDNFNTRSLRMEMVLENSETRTWKYSDRKIVVRKSVRIEDRQFFASKFILPERLPAGYHRLSIEVGDKLSLGMVICATRRAYVSPVDNMQRECGGNFFLFMHYMQMIADKQAVTGTWQN